MTSNIRIWATLHIYLIDPAHFNLIDVWSLIRRPRGVSQTEWGLVGHPEFPSELVLHPGVDICTPGGQFSNNPLWTMYPLVRCAVGIDIQPPTDVVCKKHLRIGTMFK